MTPSKSPKFPPIGFLIREIRLKQRLTARELAKRVKIDPRLLNAIEKGRIHMPSMERIADLAYALGLDLSRLFAQYCGRRPEQVSQGSASGEFVMDFGKKGFKLISYTVPVREMFCGKMTLSGKKRVDTDKFSLPVMVFIQVLIGKLAVEYQDKAISLREGGTLLLNGANGFTFQNLSQRETSLLFFTSPAPWGQSFFDR